MTSLLSICGTMCVNSTVSVLPSSEAFSLNRVTVSPLVCISTKMGPLYQKEALDLSPVTWHSFPSVVHCISSFLAFPLSVAVMCIELSPSSITQVAPVILLLCNSLFAGSNCHVPVKLGLDASCAVAESAKTPRIKHAERLAILRMQHMLA